MQTNTQFYIYLEYFFRKTGKYEITAKKVFKKIIYKRVTETFCNIQLIVQRFKMSCFTIINVVCKAVSIRIYTLT